MSRRVRGTLDFSLPRGGGENYPPKGGGKIKSPHCVTGVGEGRA